MSKKKQNATESELVNFVNAKAEGQKPEAVQVKKTAKAKTSTPKAEKKTAKAKTGGKAKAGKKTTAVDAFGNRAGSKVAQVNAMLSKTKPIKMKAIKEKMGDTFYNHIGDLMEKKLVKQTKEGYLIA